ncbi:MAG TPA: sugar ABC transporter permease [Clostridiaceae bacterium]|nr:sugar ABC transporter permease [Clostridiaceae bacterium]
MKKKKDSIGARIKKAIVKDWQLFILIMIPISFVIVFHYIPIYGVQIAFKSFKPSLGIMRSPWIGFDNFKNFFNSWQFSRIIVNTLRLSFYGMLISPLPVILALQINYITNAKYRKAVQMITYAPYFISNVVLVGIINLLLNVRTGPLNNLIYMITGQQTDILGSATAFPHLFTWSGVWKSLGFNAIIYISTLAGVDVELHEAAICDGANLLKRIWHIDIPHVLPTYVLLLILSMRNILQTNFEKVFLMQNSLNIRTSEVISTYVYKVGLVANIPNYGLGTAIGLFNSLVGLILLIIVNRIADKVAGYGFF